MLRQKSFDRATGQAIGFNHDSVFDVVRDANVDHVRQVLGVDAIGLQPLFQSVDAVKPVEAVTQPLALFARARAFPNRALAERDVVKLQFGLRHGSMILGARGEGDYVAVTGPGSVTLEASRCQGEVAIASVVVTKTTPGRFSLFLRLGSF